MSFLIISGYSFHLNCAYERKGKNTFHLNCTFIWSNVNILFFQLNYIIYYIKVLAILATKKYIYNILACYWMVLVGGNCIFPLPLVVIVILNLPESQVGGFTDLPVTFAIQVESHDGGCTTFDRTHFFTFILTHDIFVYDIKIIFSNSPWTRDCFSSLSFFQKQNSPYLNSELWIRKFMLNACTPLGPSSCPFAWWRKYWSMWLHWTSMIEKLNNF